MHRITGLDLLRTLMLCLVQLSKWRESKATDAEKLLSERKLLNAILRVTLKYMKDVSSHEMKCYLQCRRQISCLELFLRAKNTNAVRAKNTNAVFSAISKWRECKDGCWKDSFSVKKGAKCNFKSTAQVHERCFFFLKWNVICNAEDRFSCVRAFLQSKSC